ncbi:uncharacterized protein LOC143286917 [Babylonia areolata]|uniref:uncharacterized protein LOC143286917 n=1 Tax=Babylonia areolata TaxID=304850 RepID=UPI003FD37A2B
MVMANPVQRNLWGSEMSQERAQNRGKDGGAHDSPHETSFDDGILYLSKETLSSDVREIGDVNSLQLVQDGGAISLLSGDGEDMVDMYPYDQSVSENAEWVKTKCKSLSIDFDGVGEENVGDILGLGTESKVDNLMTMGGQFLSSGISEDNGIILCSDGVNLPASSISSGNDAKCSDIIPLCSLSDDLNSRTDQVLCPPSLQSAENGSNILLDSSGGGQSSVFNDSAIPATLENSSISFTTFSSKPNQKMDTVEDLTSSNQISLLETSFPSLASTSQSLLTGTCAIASSVSDSSLTGGILPNFLGIDTLTTPGNELGVLTEGSSAGSAENENLQQSVLLTIPESDHTSVSTAGSEESTKIDLMDPTNITLAMISVSTDKDANSTQIVVNTSQGQQLYMVNTANLNQASSNAVPIAQPVDNISTVQGIPAIQSSGSQNQYILLPVVTSAVVEGSLPQEEGDGREKLVCPERGCGKTFTKLSKLKIHTMQHTGERPFKCSKEGCDWAFTTAYKLKRHEDSHEGKKDFYCDYEGCNRKFTTIYNLNSHRRLHDRPCTEKCPEEGCNARFPTKRHLELHMKTHTGDERTYRCPYPGCETVFLSALNIGSHARIHKEREPDLRCNYEGCGKVFDRLCRLKQHVRQHTGEKPYKCDFEGCTWAFTTASKLKRHSAKHYNLRKYKCDQCDKSFMRPEHLKGHLVTHTGVKPFVCPVDGCDSSFTARSSLYVHLNKHKEGNKMIFYCPIDGCSRKYSTKPQLRAHIVNHYMDVPEDGVVSRQEIAQVLRAYVSDEDPDGKEGTQMEGLGGEEEEGGQFREGGVEITHDQLTNAAVSQLLSMPVTISVESSQALSTTPNTITTTTTAAAVQPTIRLESSLRRPVLKNRSGCARTDFQSNHRISSQVRQQVNQEQQESDAQVAVPSDNDLSLVPAGVNSDMLVKQEGEMYTPTDSSLAALSFRDPDTGLTFVHTQLLQDDPPQTVYYNGDTLGLSGDSSDLNTHSVLDMVPSQFTNTTINLNDLV